MFLPKEKLCFINLVLRENISIIFNNKEKAVEVINYLYSDELGKPYLLSDELLTDFQSCIRDRFIKSIEIWLNTYDSNKYNFILKIMTSVDMCSLSYSLRDKVFEILCNNLNSINIEEINNINNALLNVNSLNQEFYNNFDVCKNIELFLRQLLNSKKDDIN